MHYDSEQVYDQVLPELIALDRKATPSKVNKVNQDELLPTKGQEAKKNVSQADGNAKRKVSVQIGSTVRKNQPAKKVVVDQVKQKKIEMSKNLISEMMSKISLKSVSEENYPVSNQTAQKLMLQLDQQLTQLKQERSKFENSLLLNPSNQHLKNQLIAVEKNVNKIQTIKELYAQKIQNRSKISYLEEKIMNLKNENKELKVKIERGIEKIESHIHNLPCQRQKELIEQVNKYKQLLQRQTQMRQNLQRKIQSINLNCQRFYQQAQIARKVVRDQLKAIQKKEQQLNYKLDTLKKPKSQQKSDHMGTELVNSMLMMKKNTYLSDDENIADAINRINKQERSDKINLHPRARNTTLYSNPDPHEDLKQTRKGQQFQKKTSQNQSKKVKQSYGQSSFNNINMYELQGDTRRGKSAFNMKQQIEKMRQNQVQFGKLSKRNR